MIKSSPLKLLLVPLIFTFTSGTLTPYSYTPSLKTPGLHFEKLSDIHFLSREWNIIALANMKNVFNYGPLIIQKYEQLIPYCQNRESSNYCPQDYHVTLEVSKREQFNKYFTLIDGLLQYSEDLNNSSFISQAINKHKETPRSFYRLPNAQTHIIESSILDIPKDLLDLDDTMPRYSQTSISLQHYKMQATQWLNQLPKITEKHLNTLEQLYTILTFTQMKKWHPAILGTYALDLVVTDIKKNIPNVFLPKNSTFLQLLEISEVKTYYVNETIYFHVTIPLPDIMKYNFYKLYPSYNFPITTINKTITTYIEPQNTYLAISERNETYFFTNNHFHQTCQSTFFGKLCSSIQVLKSTKVNTPCEVALFLHFPKPTCTIKTISKIQCYSSPLTTKKGWIYYSPYTQNIHISCPLNLKTSFSSKIQGLIEIQPNCILAINDTQFRTAVKEVETSTPFSQILHYSSLTNNSFIHRNSSMLSPTFQVISVHISIMLILLISNIILIIIIILFALIHFYKKGVTQETTSWNSTTHYSFPSPNELNNQRSQNNSDGIYNQELEIYNQESSN